MSDFETPFVDDPVEIVDRSTLERFANCPQQGALIELHKLSTGGAMADVGSACHDIASQACQQRFAGVAPQAIREFIAESAYTSRPDIQPQVIVAMRRAAWKMTDILCRHPTGQDRHPEDLILFDGGHGEQSGQLSMDIIPKTEDTIALRLTNEIDLMLATPSPEEVDVWDWKGGWKWWTAGAVGDSFQFGCYSLVIFHNYPKLQKINYRVYMTAEDTATAEYVFERSKLGAIHARVLRAAQLYREHKGKASAPAWPSPAKCSLCPAATKCSYVHKPEGELALDQIEYLKQYIAIQAAADQMHATLTQYVRETGEELEYGRTAFGDKKPKGKEKAAKCVLYDIPGGLHRDDPDNDPPPADGKPPAPRPRPVAVPSPRPTRKSKFMLPPRKAPAVVSTVPARVDAPAPVVVEDERLFTPPAGSWEAIEDASEPNRGEPIE